MANANPKGMWLLQTGIIEGEIGYTYTHIKRLLQNMDIHPERYIRVGNSYIRVIFRTMQDKNLFLLSCNLKVQFSGNRGKRVYRYDS